MMIENERKQNFELKTTNIKQIDPCAIPAKKSFNYRIKLFVTKKVLHS